MGGWLVKTGGKKGGGEGLVGVAKCQKHSTVEGCLFVKCAFSPCMEMIVVCAGGINTITVLMYEKSFQLCVYREHGHLVATVCS